MRLIDADQLKELILKERDAIPKTISERYGFGIGRPNNHGNSMRGGIRKALKCMEQCPTIKVETVKHGRWIEVKQPDSYGLRVMQECSCCGSRENWRANYRPNCGCRMDGGKE